MTGLRVRRFLESVLGVGRFCWKKYQVFGFSLGWGEMFESSQLLFLISFYYLAIGKSLKKLERVSGMVRYVLLGLQKCFAGNLVTPTCASLRNRTSICRFSSFGRAKNQIPHESQNLNNMPFEEDESQSKNTLL